MYPSISSNHVGSFFTSSNQLPSHYQPVHNNGYTMNNYQHSPFSCSSSNSITACPMSMHIPTHYGQQQQQSNSSASIFPLFNAPSMSSPATSSTTAHIPSLPFAAMPAASSSSTIGATSTTSSSTRHPKRPRSIDDETDARLLTADELLPSVKRIHSGPTVAPSTDDSSKLLDTDPIMRSPSAPMDDEPMSCTPLSQSQGDPLSRSPSPLPDYIDVSSPSVAPATPPVVPASEQIDGEIDTDQWNLSKLQLEVNDQFQPFLNSLSSEQAKRAAGFDPSILRELHHEYMEQQRRGNIVRAVWNKNAAYMQDPTCPCFPAMQAPPAQQLMVLYQKPSSKAAGSPLRGKASSRATLELDTSSTPPLPKVVRSSPIVTEVDDDEPASPASNSGMSYRSAASSPTSAASSSSFHSMFSNSNSASSTTPFTVSSSSTALKREKRRRASSDDLALPHSKTNGSTVKIEEISEEDHDAKRTKLKETEQNNITAADLANDATMSDDEPIMNGSMLLSPNGNAGSASFNTFPSHQSSHVPSYNPHVPTSKHPQSQHQNNQSRPRVVFEEQKENHQPILFNQTQHAQQQHNQTQQQQFAAYTPQQAAMWQPSAPAMQPGQQYTTMW